MSTFELRPSQAPLFGPPLAKSSCGDRSAGRAGICARPRCDSDTRRVWRKDWLDAREGQQIGLCIGSAEAASSYRRVRAYAAIRCVPSRQ